MRLPIATDIKTRTGAPSTKDARQVNSYIETKGEQSAVRKRPAAQGGIALGTGTAQGGIGLTIGGTPYFFGFWGDTMQTYTGSGTTWNSGANYLIGDHVSVGFVDYWAINNNTNSHPPSGNWSSTYIPALPKTYATWNPNDKTPGMNLSNGNLTASTQDGGVRSTIGKASGKWYFEIHVDLPNSGADVSTIEGVGVLTGTAYLGNEIGNFGTDEWGYNIGGNGVNAVSVKETNGITTAYGSVYTAGDIIGVGLDMDAKQVTFYLNGVSQGVAFTGLTGTVYAGVGQQSGAAFQWQVTANFGASAFSYTPPVGFNSGLYQ